MRSTGVTRSAWSAHCRTSGVPASAPRSSRAAAPAGSAGVTHRSTASVRAASQRSTLSPLGAGTTLVTTWVRTPAGYGGYGWPHDRRQTAPAPGARTRSRPARARPARRLDRPHLHALPRHRAGLRGGVLRPALAAAAHPRAGRRSRLRRERHRPGPGRRRASTRSTPTPRSSSPPTSSRTPCSPRSRTWPRGPRFDLLSLGFVLSLWSGSRALNVFVDTISIMYGQSGVRGIVRTRALSFSLYLLALALGIVTIPLVLLGPSLLGEILPAGVDLADRPVLAAGHPADRRRPHQPLPHLDAAAVAVAARRPRRRGDHGPVDRRLLRRPRHDRRVAGRRHVDLRAAVGADRAADLALHPGDRRAHRGRRQRVDPRAATRTRSSAACTSGWERGSADLRRRRTERHERPAGWDDPFDGYGPVDADDDLGLSGLREAARGPLTPMSGAGRGAATASAPPGRGRPPGRRRALRPVRPARGCTGLEIVTAIG